ncbi:acetyl-CoA synthetase-like protein [Exidia glandulosa HHB12029]|uniref:Acetyl-CoA synthetase-like protein n=1 Tax=Exidia glandulosa HHB12029 TaxID=1314781 RepID=A0A165NIT4_EXIGL|nr:acetyl-CoA synthetase-like protein [Exidia glandulosa HHB12029]
MPAATYFAQSLTDLLAKRVQAQGDEPCIYTGAPDCEELLQSLTYADVQKAVDRLAWHYSTLNLVPTTVNDDGLPSQRTVAVLTSSSYDESLLEMALCKLGLTPLLLSVNNSVPAVAHLCKLTNAAHLVYGAKYVQEAHEAQTLLKEQGYTLELVEDKRFPFWGENGVRASSVKPFAPVLTADQERMRPAIILHSSGSTGFPKPVYITHYGLIANVALNQNKTGFSTLPVYHGYGHFSIFRCMYAGKPITLFPGHLPLTSANICAVLAASPDVRQCYAVPYVIKLLAETAEGTKALASFDVVSYAGAALPDDLGDRLTEAGVNLLSIYGTTETGSLMNSNRDFTTDKFWNWVRPLAGSAHYLVFEDRGSGTYELVVKDGYPPKIETNRPDGSYATKDLFVRHRDHPNLYKYFGRLDDTLVQTLGEKTNPVPIELSIRGNSPYVAEAIVFGAGRPQTGCLILPSELGKDMSREELMEKVWPVVEQANADAPSHSRLLPEMVEFLPYGTHVPIATKMTILRPACYALFKDLINDIYDRFEKGSGVEKQSLSGEALETFIFNTIVKTMGHVKGAQLTRDVDLFAFGVDSLQGTRIRNTLQQSLELGEHKLGQNIVYEYPSVTKLAAYITALVSSDGAAPDADGHEALMLKMVEDFSARFVNPTATSPKVASDGHVVVLTGASGSLGAHILAQLVASPDVKTVICLSRASSHADSLERLRGSLAQRKLDESLLDSKVESYAANANVDLLGLSQGEFDSIPQRATVVIHNAWPVNFNLALQSYDVHIGGTVNLINLCLETGAAFYFSSSISCRQGAPDETCSEDFATSPKTAGGTGYARSKWVVEKLCERAGQVAPGLTIGVLRIGQMVGDTVNGVWNETEAWPLMIKGANTVGALPQTGEHPSWLPVDYAARAVKEIVLSSHTSGRATVYHVVNPNTSASWDDLLAALHDSGVQFKAVPTEEWLRVLGDSEKDPDRNPVIKLLGFFEKRYSSRRKPMVFLTEETSQVAPSIRDAPPVSKELVAKWVSHWRTVGFLA